MSFQSLADLEPSLRSGTVTVRDLYTAWDLHQSLAEAGAGNESKTAGATVQSRRDPPAHDDLALAELFTRRALEQEEFLLVCDSAPEALRLPDHPGGADRAERVHIRMHYAAALARLGHTRRARRELEPCVAENFHPPLPRKLQADVLLQIGDILRQESRFAVARVAQVQTAEQALEYYQRALNARPERLDPLGRAATVAFGIAERGSALHGWACDQARAVLEGAAAREHAGGRSFENTSLRAAGHAVLGEIDEAARAYGELRDLPDVDVSALADTRYWAQGLAEALGLGRDFFNSAFPPLPLIVFSGHLSDLPGQTPRFPLSSVPAARDAIDAALGDARARVGLVCAAAGADLLFIEALRKRGGIFHVVLPWSREEFRRTSVRPFEPPAGEPALWEPLFEQALATAATIREIDKSYGTRSSVVYEYLMEVTAGLALHAARVSRLDVQPMVLWDERPGRGAGGTASFVDFWRRQLGREPIIVRPPRPSLTLGSDTAAAGDAATGDHLSLAPPPGSERDTLRQEVKSMIFADIVGYSKLTEAAIPEFVSVFLGRVSCLLADSRHAPRHVNTWGDAIYAVFDFAYDAGCFALELALLVHEGQEDWRRAGLYWDETLPGGGTAQRVLNIRVGLHTGPVFMHYNPVVRQLGFTGVHVSRAARIEPVAAPGEVFASEEFAALSEADAEIARREQLRGNASTESGEGFVCEYAGSMPLAKGYPGRHRVYRVLPSRAFAIEELARAIHEAYCSEAIARGETPPGENGSLRAWEELPEDLRNANYAQAADIPNKLHALGFELAPGSGMHARQLVITDGEVETLAIREHERWAQERRRRGWVYAAARDNSRKLHPLLVTWAALSEPEREKDRDTVRNLPWLIEKAGFRVRKISGER